MAFYEYLCKNPECQHQWEDEHPMSEPARTQCPKCLQETATRLISRTSFQLVGGGWGDTGYK